MTATEMTAVRLGNGGGSAKSKRGARRKADDSSSQHGKILVLFHPKFSLGGRDRHWPYNA
jgi:hypothetical protein